MPAYLIDILGDIARGLDEIHELSEQFEQSIIRIADIIQLTGTHDRFDYNHPMWNNVDIYKPFIHSKTVEKVIDKLKNTECPITYDEIKKGDVYMRCTSCKYNFSEPAVMKHLTEKRSCPMCRCVWKDTCKYINKLSKTAVNFLKNIDVLKNVFSKNFTKNYNIIGHIKNSRYNKRWNYENKR